MIIFTEVNRNNIYYLTNEKIINLVNNYNYILYNNRYYYEYKNFKDYYIIYNYIKNKLSFINYSNYSGELHREDGPACIDYDENGEIYIQEYWLNGKEYSYEDYLLEIKKLF